MIAEGILLKQLGILLFSAVKFLLAAPASYLIGYSYFHTLLNITAGGLLGVFFFFYMSRILFRLYRRFSPLLFNTIRQLAGISAQTQVALIRKKGLRKIFTKKNRFIIKIRRSYGLTGIIILTPVLFSIPLGTFLALKYYSSRPNLLGWLSLSVIIWAFVLTTFMELL
ncbi:MAG: hypothetical protein V1775_09285 [Bacteroidota bacterium]